MPTFDWPDRPKASPTGTALIQSRYGHNGNLEVIIPWPNGGLAHFWRDNDVKPGVWRTPTVFSEGKYLGASIIESYNKFTNANDAGNLEILAVRDTGELEHWFRENGEPWQWHRLSVAATGATGAPALAFTGAFFEEGLLDFDRGTHRPSQFWAAVPEATGGLLLLSHYNDAPLARPGWQVEGRLTPDTQFPDLLNDRMFVGVGLALTCLHAGVTPAWSWKEMQNSIPDQAASSFEIGDVLVAATSIEGALSIFVWSEDFKIGTPLGIREWSGGVSITVPVDPDATELRGFRGRPSLLQSDYAVNEDSLFIPFEANHHGNLELLCAAKQGGIHHFWRDNGGNGGEPASWEGGWHYAGRIGSKVYDDVSVIQSSFGAGKHGNLEVIARSSDQAGFDFFYRDEDWRWQGPAVVSEQSTSIAQPLQINDGFKMLIDMGLDFSVQEDELRSWLHDPHNTPYPAITSALQSLLRGNRLKRPVFIDVVVFNYEQTPGITSPRAGTDVSPSILIAALLEGHNKRYGEQLTELSKLL